MLYIISCKFSRLCPSGAHTCTPPFCRNRAQYVELQTSSASQPPITHAVDLTFFRIERRSMSRVAALFVCAATLIYFCSALTVPQYASQVYPQKRTAYGISHVPGNPDVQVILTDKGVWVTGRNFSTHHSRL
jgi:hypothetical protein